MASGEKKQNVNKLAAEEYLRKNHIVELFEDLCTAIAYKKPDNIEHFLVEQLELRKKKGIHVPVFNVEEVENIFNLFDLKQEKQISRQKCREALKSMANTQKQMELAEDYVDIPQKVDLATFKKLCEDVLGIK